MLLYNITCINMFHAYGTHLDTNLDGLDSKKTTRKKKDSACNKANYYNNHIKLFSSICFGILQYWFPFYLSWLSLPDLLHFQLNKTVISHSYFKNRPSFYAMKYHLL